LFSPPRCPSYNGSIEAGIGSLKTRTYHHACRDDHPHIWTTDDVEEARVEANALSRPWGASGPIPDEVWKQRTPIDSEERDRFQTAVARERQAELTRREQEREKNPTPKDDADSRQSSILPPAQSTPAERCYKNSEPGPLASVLTLAEPVAAGDTRLKERTNWSELRRAERASVDRIAIRRALVAHGYLVFRRRRIPSPITRYKTAIII
jgi:hypothetical protein